MLIKIVLQTGFSDLYNLKMSDLAEPPRLVCFLSLLSVPVCSTV